MNEEDVIDLLLTAPYGNRVLVQTPEMGDMLHFRRGNDYIDKLVITGSSNSINHANALNEEIGQIYYSFDQICQQCTITQMTEVFFYQFYLIYLDRAILFLSVVLFKHIFIDLILQSQVNRAGQKCHISHVQSLSFLSFSIRTEASFYQFYLFAFSILSFYQLCLSFLCISIYFYPDRGIFLSIQHIFSVNSIFLLNQFYISFLSTRSFSINSIFFLSILSSSLWMIFT